MNPFCLCLLGLGLILGAAQAEAAGPKVTRVKNLSPEISVPSGDARAGAEEVIRRRREYPHHLFVPGAPKPQVQPLSTLLARAREAAPRQAAVDTMRIAWIRVEFAENSVPGQVTGTGRFMTAPDPSVPVDPPPHNKAYFEAHGEALKRYYFTQSYESLVMESTIYPPGDNAAYVLSDPADYGPWNVGQDITIINQAEDFVIDAVLAADETGDIDFSRVDGVIVVHAGADFQGDVNGDSPYDIPSFTLTFATPLPTTTGTVPRVSVIPETTSQDDLLGALNGVAAHEVGHLLELPDLYNIFNGAPQVGWFSLMDSGDNLVVIVGDAEGNILFEARGTTPTSLDPWSKLFAFPGAAQRLFVGSGGAPFTDGVWEGELTPGITNPAIPLVPVSGTEYFLLENRAPDLDGNGTSFTDQDDATGVFLGPLDDEDLPGQGGGIEYDWPLPGNGGVAIWHIDDDIVNLGLSVQGGVNLNLNIRGVALEEADGIWDIGYNTGFPYGHPNDLFFLGNNILFDPFTTPSTEANTGAFSGVTIQIQDPQQESMTVRIANPLVRPDWPFSVGFGFELHHLSLTALYEDVLPVVSYGNPDIEEYGFFVPTTALGGLHNVALTNPLTSRDNFEFTPGNRDFLLSTIDQKGQLVAWNGEGERLFVAGQALSGTPRIARMNGDRDLLLVEADAGVEAWNAAGSMVGKWEFNALPRGSNAALYPDDTFVAAFLNTVVHFDPDQVGPLRAVSVGDPIERVLLGRSGTATADIFAFSSDRAFVIDGESWEVNHVWNLPEAPAAGPILVDVDHDGELEVSLADSSGTVWVHNADGSRAVGWPRSVEDDVTQLRSLDLDGDGSLNLVAATAEGLLLGFAADGEPLAAFPRALCSGPARSLEFGVHDARLMSFALTERRMWSWNLPGSSAPPGAWSTADAGPSRRGYVATPEVQNGGPDLGPSDFLVYPNPAVNRDVEFRFHLDPGDTFEIEIVDAAGRFLDADLDLRGAPRSGENAVQWRVQDVAPGLYYGLLRRTGAGGSRLDKVKVAVVH